MITDFVLRTDYGVDRGPRGSCQPANLKLISVQDCYWCVLGPIKHTLLILLPLDNISLDDIGFRVAHMYVSDSTEAHVVVVNLQISSLLVFRIVTGVY